MEADEASRKQTHEMHVQNANAANQRVHDDNHALRQQQVEKQRVWTQLLHEQNAAAGKAAESLTEAHLEAQSKALAEHIQRMQASSAAADGRLEAQRSASMAIREQSSMTHKQN